jgi:hypothetical protein
VLEQVASIKARLIDVNMSQAQLHQWPVLRSSTRSSSLSRRHNNAREVFAELSAQVDTLASQLTTSHTRTCRPATRASGCRRGQDSSLAVVTSARQPAAACLTFAPNRLDMPRKSHVPATRPPDGTQISAYATCSRSRSVHDTGTQRASNQPETG